MIFDQYSRYKACSDLLRQAGFTAGDSILDIGSGPECLFGQFMPDATMNFVDPLITKDAGQGYISGNVFSSELNGRDFDCVTAIDVLEHVPPESRQEFLQRVASLATDTIILGFPTSESSVAKEVDEAVEAQYRTVYGKDYPWLEEHHKFGLPSLEETLDQLQQLGWSCQTIGHGYAPWLKDLLSFVINTWEIHGLKDLVLDVSEEFNRRLYKYDYEDPSYRQFIIASRSVLPAISAPAGANDAAGGQKEFFKIFEHAKKQYFIQSLQLLSSMESAFEKELGAVVGERDGLLAERDKLILERDEALAALNAVKASRSWRLTRPIRFLSRFSRMGLINEDRRRISDSARARYHQLPLPAPVKRTFSFVYHKIIRKVIKMLRRFTTRPDYFCAPTFKPCQQNQSVPDYIVFGVIDWHFRHQRPQQLAQALAGAGRRIFYISPLLVDDERAGFEVENLDDSDLLFQVKLFAKHNPSIYNSAPSIEIINQLRASIGEVIDWANCGQLISLVHHPFWYETASVLPNSHMVYDCMDHHEGFGNNGESLMQLEKELLYMADICITTSAWLEESVSDYTKNCTLIRNAGDYDHFSSEPSSVYQDPQRRHIIGYYGAIAEWFDLDLVEAVAKRFPECAVVLVGRDTAQVGTRLGKLPNVMFTGEVDYERLPYYLYSFDVCMLPFKIIPLTLATNPVKVYEYLSAGKPLVSVDLPEMNKFDELVYVASDKEKFLDTVNSVLTKPEAEALIQRRKDFASGQTWENRADELVKVAESTVHEPGVSVIVVTYNNLELTKACLSSLDEHSLYKNLEIIVVDNASSDGSQGFLKEWVSDGSNRKLVLNDKNLGFAAANNQGLKKASGDFLVLLNNDTYVTSGWVRTLVSHLQRDKTIGVIGPVTNNIGNEAKIDIHYEDMSDMLNKAAAFTRRHIGQLYSLNTAAFFCVMMERKTYEKVGSLDEEFGRGFFEDDDYCRRIEEIGLRVVCAEDVFVHHHLSASFDKLNDDKRKELFNRNKEIYEKKWGKWLPHGYR